MFKKSVKLFILIFLIGPFVAAQANLVNEVLFSVAGQSWTSRDRQLYEVLLQEVYTQDKISKFSVKKKEDFLLSRLSAREADAFDLKPEAKNLADAAKKKLSEFSETEIEKEINLISKSLNIIELKEVQLKQQERFDSWFELLKRKYQVKIKSNEFK